GSSRAADACLSRPANAMPAEYAVHDKSLRLSISCGTPSQICERQVGAYAYIFKTDRDNTIRITSTDPSVIIKPRESFQNFWIGVSSDSPVPPKICMQRSAALNVKLRAR